MNKTNSVSSLCKTALLSLGVALSLVLVPITTLKAADTTGLQPLTDKAEKALLLSHSFVKVAGENGPYELKLTNTSKESVKVTIQVLLSVYSHATAKARNLPEQEIAAGKEITVPQLAAQDKVIINAHGHAPLELIVK